MKRTLLFLALPLFAVRAFAIFGVGDIVHDPLSYGVIVETKVETLAKWADQIKKMEDQISHQLEMIEKTKSLLNSSNQLKASIGDWAGVIDGARSLKLRVDDLTKDFSVHLRGEAVLDYNQWPPPVRRDAYGAVVEVSPDYVVAYSQVDKVGKATAELLESTTQEMKEINKEIGETYEAMTKSGLSQQEYEKLRGKVQTLGIRLQSLQAQQQSALQTLQAQSVVSLNNQARDAELDARAREQTHRQTVDGLSSLQIDELKWR